MNIAGVRLGQVSDRDRVALLESARAAGVTYDFVGVTLDPARSGDPGVYVRSVDAGRGEAAFRAARAALETWVPQRGIGTTVFPPAPGVHLGGSVVQVLRRGPFAVVAPVRIVAVIDEPRRYAYAYGTLPGHPERGEEGFDVTWLADDTVRITIRVRAGAATLAARAAGPIVRRLQAAALYSYLDAIARHVVAEADNGGTLR